MPVFCRHPSFRSLSMDQRTNHEELTAWFEEFDAVVTSEIKLKQNCCVSVVFQFYFRCNHCLRYVKFRCKYRHRGLRIATVVTFTFQEFCGPAFSDVDLVGKGR